MNFGPYPIDRSQAVSMDGRMPSLAEILGVMGTENIHPLLRQLTGVDPKLPGQDPRKRRPLATEWMDVPKLAADLYDAAEPHYRRLHAALAPGVTAYFDLTDHRLTDPDPADPFVVPITKAADQTLASDVGDPLAHMVSLKRNPVNDLVGGPTPLATALTGSALGAGMGYLGGAAIERLVPRSVMERGKLRRSLATIGGVAGAVPGLYLGHLGAAADGTSYWNGMTSPGVLSGEQKEADAGGFGVEVPVDAFNRLVMFDPFVPPSVGAATVALATAADRATGRTGLITPFDLARIAVGAGAGYLQAYAGAKLLGGLAGLTPDAQRALQQTGYVAGALKSVIPGMFGL